jgi:SAM-dependent methyltransferase
MSRPGDSYIYSQAWEQERARLSGLSASFDPITVRHLDAVGVGSGWHCLEVGAGAGSIAQWLAGRVGSAGRVVATDLDTRFLERLAEPPIEVRRHDLTTDPIEPGAFDLVHARAVLEHLPNREELAGRLAGALRPGGVLVLEDVVFGGVAQPAWQLVTSPAEYREPLTRVFGAVAGGFRALGADPEFGLRLPTLLAEAGLAGVQAEMTHRLVHGGSPESAFYSLSVRELADRLIAAGLLARQDAELASEFLTDPSASWLSLGMLSAWGRRA